METNTNFQRYTLMKKIKKLLVSDLRAHFNQEDFKLNKDNDPRFYSNILSLDNEDLILEKGYLRIVKIVVKTNAHRGLYKQKKYNTAHQKKQSITLMRC